MYEQAVGDMHIYAMYICMLIWFQFIYLDDKLFNYRDRVYTHIIVTHKKRIFEFAHGKSTELFSTRGSTNSEASAHYENGDLL